MTETRSPTRREAVSGGPCCAHSRVSYRTKQIEGGLTTGWWECDSNCGMRFTTLPHAAAIEAENLARDAASLLRDEGGAAEERRRSYAPVSSGEGCGRGDLREVRCGGGCGR